jgi:O-acetyl-ADP-ribose deacetylase (regulator of RNase III)
MRDGNSHTDSGTGHASGGVRFGRTLVLPGSGHPIDQHVDVVVCAANGRGVMGVGVAGSIRLTGGAEIERQIMAHAPLVVGAAYVTDSGELATRGIHHIIHAVVADALGSPSRGDTVRRATSATLTVADRIGALSLAIPPLGAGLGPATLGASTVWLLMIEEIVAHLRRFHSRLERIVLMCRDEREVIATRKALQEARVLWLEQRVQAPQ